MEHISTLVPDIYRLVTSNRGGPSNVGPADVQRDLFQEGDESFGAWFTEEVSDALRTSIASRLAEQFNAKRYAPGKAGLRMSGLGPKCPRALWYSVHHPEMAENLPPWAEIKFAYGNVLEALCLTLARAAGHSVLGEQDEIYLDGVPGHRDAVIDGAVVDVKSCSSLQFQKIKSGAIEQDDSFGYLDQLSGYVVASADDPLVSVKDRGYILAVDKVLGHLWLHEHKVEPSKIRERIKRYQDLVTLSDPPPCECKTIPHGTSGNRKLAFPASYSPYKHCCFPGIRTFLYSKPDGGPTYLTKVVVKPNVPEINREGRYVW